LVRRPTTAAGGDQQGRAATNNGVRVATNNGLREAIDKTYGELLRTGHVNQLIESTAKQQKRKLQAKGMTVNA
jgi:hypothetical protein